MYTQINETIYELDPFCTLSWAHISQMNFQLNFLNTYFPPNIHSIEHFEFDWDLNCLILSQFLASFSQ